ncbi:MAG: LysR family transcriptional regulator [Porticoccaceae bacterium]|jgi:DNA-binding transcriptional LysR family regulator|nr:LysR family transcriptional regulator [Porticoccaceae bacterium]MBT6028615.1 LysR family transcriptional regulator [Porticoccaceae bacterium]MBT6693028.1 LysR family transcriptional regulator [Porticoccaceae bacterium]MBT7168800.1 LysR family transcriptional regulator [Porticoccaceae bacterium]|tara:strand:+ start:182 stop:1048 length:867 start_codon:yes stop_codon:yes gene_type:complete
MDKHNLNAFIAVAETKSFSSAAEILHVTQSTISKRIALLETTMGQKLFDRIARQVSVTPAGAELLPRAKHMVQEYQNAIQAINDLAGNTSGILRLAISHHLGLHRLPPLLKTYAQEHPDVILDIEFMDSEKAYEQVLQGHSEVAVITLALEQHYNITRNKIWNDCLRFVCAQDHPLSKVQEPRLAHLAEYPVILPGLNTYTGRIVQNLFQAEDIRLKSPMSTNYLETISTMVEVGLGWSVLPETLVKNLHVIPISGCHIQRELGYIHHTKKTLSNSAKAFIALINPPL